MLPQHEHEGPTIPAPAEVLEVLAGYADALDGALAQTPTHYRGPAYLPTLRAIRAGQAAADALVNAAGALAQSGAFAAPVLLAGHWCRPVDAIDAALVKVREARALVTAHQAGPAPRENKAGVMVMGEWLATTDDDLSELLGPVLALLGRVEP